MATTAGNGVWSRIGRGLTRLRNFVLNGLFVLLLLVVVMALFSDDTPRVPEDSALLVNPRGVLVDQPSLVDPLARFLTPDAPGEVELARVVNALTRAATDDRIRLAVLDLDELVGVSAGQATVIGAAIRVFQEQDKEVVAYGTGFSQPQYLVASFADALYMHPMGQLLLPGYGTNQLYFNELLAKLDVNIHIFRAGKYKEFVEPYTRSDMSEEARLANQSLVDELWDYYGSHVIVNRDLEPGEFESFTQSLPELLREMRDLPAVAVEHHLVDELLSHDEIRARIAAKVGYAADGEFTHIDFDDYLRASDDTSDTGSGPVVAVISADGPILTGRQSQGVIAAETVMGLIRQARQEEDVKALVMQVNSPGGSAFASELIRQELELLQLAGKPVVVSMSNVAASGGYWIAATADRIFARPTTVTGSIGVFGIFPTFENALARIGVTSDGVGTTPLSGALDPFAGLSEDMGAILQLNVEQTYQQFLNLVARGRDMAPADVDEVAQGRVWTGARALALGLVDELGGLEDAISAAAELAEIAEDYEVEQLRPSLSARDLLLSSLTGIRTRLDADFAWTTPLTARIPFSRQAWQRLAETQRFFSNFDDPRDAYAICEICLPTSGLLR